MLLVGRQKEIEILNDILEKKTPQFVAVYGRRRVGKTYLLNEFFNYNFTFKVTGVRNTTEKGMMNSELKVFHDAIEKYGKCSIKAFENWFEAFDKLKTILENKDIYRDPLTNKRIVFIDELPWLDTPKSDFKVAFESFWNDYGVTQHDLVLFVCGSATSWIINNLFKNKGGFHNRVTNRIHIKPLTLRETEELLRFNGITYSRKQIIECNMVFGGVPYYINLLSKRYSFAQNVDNLCFDKYGALHNEFNELFLSLFNGREDYIELVKLLSEKKSGMLRNEIIATGRFKSGSRLTTMLNELEECSFIRKYDNPSKGKREIYQLIDSFSMFAINFLEKKKINSWVSFYNSAKYNSWSGNAFEIVCLNNIDSIKSALRINGVETNIYGYYNNSNDGAQIDLVIDRRDDVINLCEIKYKKDAFEIDSKYEIALSHKVEIFRNDIKSKKSLLLTFISFAGLKKNSHSNIVSITIMGDDLFL